jgi:hypothetical protein
MNFVNLHKAGTLLAVLSVKDVYPTNTLIHANLTLESIGLSLSCLKLYYSMHTKYTQCRDVRDSLT